MSRLHFRRLRTLAALSLLSCSGADAAVSLSMSTSNLNPVAGSAAFSYVISVTNDAAGVNNLLLTDELPPGARFLNVAVSGASAGTMQCEGPATGNAGTVSCEAASFPGNAAATITIVANFRADMAGGVRTNQARIAGGSLASAQVQQTVVNNANAVVSSIENGEGGRVVRKITVTVNGDSAAAFANYNGALPAGAIIESLTGSGPMRHACHVSPVDRILSCTARDVPAGIHTVTLAYRVVDMLFSDGFE